MTAFLTIPKGLITAGVQFNLDSLDAVSCPDSQNGGFRTSVLRLPQCVDVRKPMSVYQVLAPQAFSNLPATAIHFTTIITYVTPPGTRGNVVVDQNWTVPAPWSGAAFERVLIDNGNGWTIDGRTIPSQSVIGVHVRRIGLNPGDTWTGQANLLTSVELHYQPLPACLVDVPVV